jgi:hypothetical protein
LIEGASTGAPNANEGYAIGMGETLLFWTDLSMAGLIDSNFSTATGNVCPVMTTSNVELYYPFAKIGKGNFLYIYSGGWSGTDAQHYFGLSALTSVSSCYLASSTPMLTVAQAYSMDKKIDDGLPQSGKVTAMSIDQGAVSIVTWAGNGGGNLHHGASSGFDGSGGPTTTATAGTSTTCYDNSAAASGTPGVAGAAQHYSMEIGTGNNANCALSFRMQ